MARSTSRTERAGHAALLAGGLLLCGCLAPFTHQPEPVPVLGGEVLVQPPSPLEAKTGSLWRNNVSANFLFTDVRASMPGDLLTIVVSEDDSGTKAAETDTKNKATILEGITQFFGLTQAWASHNSNVNPDALIQANSDREWTGGGATKRAGTLTANMTVEVKAVSPTGNLWVQGDKIVSVNKEDQHMVLSGWVRPDDIDAHNQVASTRLSDARIDYYGVGPLGRQQGSGWGTTLLDYVWPF
jgi:flagellar L-ring protein precursor FlgH